MEVCGYGIGRAATISSKLKPLYSLAHIVKPVSMHCPTT
ncbi:hypothetical protein SLEP1_g19155 [Rubroshorea leprosula]|nr:hypothetical protein SLEP1_g19155 [Rubroshorea leprosula]